jgi:exonuclease SbcC
MLKKITLSHFRQHLDRTFEFGPGMNAIRGENEAGKTTVTEGFTYFCFGVAALRESLDDVVTYHHPVSKLRIDAELEHLGVTYTGYRSKSGAEISSGGKVLVTGQREVTKFFENLFGTTADMAGKLMFASQKALAESLKAGPTAAGKMIEDLADFDLIDRVVDAIAARRPNGRTEAVESRISMLQGQLGEVVVEDIEPLKQEILHATQEVDIAHGLLVELQNRRFVLDAAGAQQTLRDHAQCERDIQTFSLEIEKLERELAREVVLAPADEEIAAARAAVEAEKHAARAAKLRTELQGVTPNQWTTDLASLEADIRKSEQDVVWERGVLDGITVSISELERAHAATVRESDVKVAQLEGRLIKETTCALCQKDLADVPEVARTNSDLQRQINEVKLAAVSAGNAHRERYAELEADQREAKERLVEHQGYLKDLNAVLAANAKVEQLYARAAEFIEVDRSCVPGIWRWTGPDAVAGESAINQLALLERRAFEAAQDAARRDEKTKQLNGLKTSRSVTITRRNGLNVEAAQDLLDQAQLLDSSIKDKEQSLKFLQAGLLALENQLGTKQALAAQAARQRALTEQQLADAKRELADMQRYNLLIKKVRAARPVITNQLWNIVLAGVSQHFSDVRGSESRITRADGAFRCNGFPVSGLSGSAEDMLGLSMRITLTKTFLPGIDMLQLDEPAAACSDAREARMLGLLAKLKFGQTILITHSDQADAFADRIITV